MLKSLFAGADTTSHRERFVSGAGAFLAILAVFELTRMVQQSLAQQMLLMAPMAASAVLVFATPNGALSQPWNVIVGHALAAFIGVVAHRATADPALAAASATGIAILV
ncbi:MAG: HPP family protein, partial [Rhizobiaceae bacterium]